jgi:hypothetical protein
MFEALKATYSDRRASGISITKLTCKFFIPNVCELFGERERAIPTRLME